MPPPPIPPGQRGKALIKARNAFLINQFATPGLGSLLAGRRWAGAGQLLLAVAGFCFGMAWFGLLMRSFYQQIESGKEGTSVAWVGEIGAGLFAVSWVWALFTSLSLERQARKEELEQLTKGGP